MTAITIGTIPDDVRTALDKSNLTSITAPEKARQRHMHIVGANGSGKSRFMRTLIQQDIRQGKGVCLIDPHGTQCIDVLKWLANRPRLSKHRRVRYFHVGNGNHTLSFNPLTINHPLEAQARATQVADSIGRLFSQDDLRHQPRTLEILVLLLMTLCELNLSLADYPIFLSSQYRSEARHLVSKLQNSLAREQWYLLEKYRDNEFTEYVSSVARRLFTLLSNPIIASSFSQIEGTLNLRKSMDDGEVLLFNLADTPLFDRTSAQLFGLLLISTFFGQSKLRQNNNPYYLYIDESHRFLSGSNLAEMFEECRKLGLHLLLAHQNLGQLRDAGERVFATVMNEAEIKAVFSIKEPEDAAYLVKLIYKNNAIDPNRIKDVLSKPTVIDYTIGLLNSASQSSSTVKGSGQNMIAGEAVSLLPEAGMLSGQQQTGIVQSSSSTDLNTKAEGAAKSTTRAETLMPVMEDRPTSTWTIDEQVFVLADELSSLKTQYGVISIGGLNTMKFRALDCPDEIIPKSQFEAFLKTLQKTNPYLTPLQPFTLKVPKPYQPEEPESYLE